MRLRTSACTALKRAAVMPPYPAELASSEAGLMMLARKLADLAVGEFCHLRRQAVGMRSKGAQDRTAG